MKKLIVVGAVMLFLPVVATAGTLTFILQISK